ncbi:glycosidase, partial [Candidatus Bathyarchaeota archaeon]|nr:glycosidase [Candidatus Bathyarchaeota archaeon]
DKDSFMMKNGDELLLFHRPHMTDNGFYLTISKVPKINEGKALKEITVEETKVVFEHANFEEKIGWGPPPVQVGKEHLFLLHAVDRKSLAYMVFAALLSLNEEVSVKAVTPCYIMKPMMPYEVYGDRPYTVFPCGLQEVDGKLLMSYGAGDSAAAFGEIDLSELMAMLDKNRFD